MSDEEFVDWWVLLRKHLEPHTKISHWSAAKGYLPGAFAASPTPYSGQECVQIEGPRRTHIYQRIIFPKQFRSVLDRWNDYCAGVISRKSIDAVTKHSTYVVSIIRWLEEKVAREVQASSSDSSHM